MDRYYYSVELPYSKKIIKFREFSTEEQLSLGKSQYSFSSDFKSYFAFIYELILECVENKDDFKQLDILEYVLFLIKLRIISVSPKIELSTTVDGQAAKITVDLNRLLQHVYDILESIDMTVDFGNDKLSLTLPLATDMAEFVSISTDPEKVLGTIPLFLMGPNSSATDKRKMFNQLPITLTTQIQSRVFEILKSLMEREIFTMDVLRDFKFNLYNNSIFELIKLVCSYDVKSIHQEIYVLSALTPSYIRSITPSERKIYLSLYQAEKAPKSQEPTINDKLTINPVDALAAEFGQTPPTA